MAAYYNENDPKAAAWLRSLIEAGLIPDGTVDERSICNVQGQDLEGFQQVHLFAGIGGWSRALQLASWPTDVPVWTGSCPCQPFSAAGQRKGEKDERHLWPEMQRLISECGPSIVFGEQVASKAGRQWLSRVRAEMEALGYAVGAADLCAAGVGAPHIRQRLWWVAYATQERWNPNRHGETEERSAIQRSKQTRELSERITRRGETGRLADTDGGDTGEEHGQQPQDGGSRDGMGNSRGTGLQERIGNGRIERSQTESSPWETFVLASCRDGKARRIEPGTFPLAHGIPGRVAQLRGLGNAIVPQVAAEFIGAFLDVLRGL